MMEGKGIAVCIIAGVLAIISAVLGFVAEATKVKASDIRVDFISDMCVYPSSPASVLGFISALTLLIAFIVINSAGGCFCCYKSNRCQCNGALVCFIFSWLTFVPGLLLLLAGAAASMSGRTDRVRENGTSFYTCSYLKPGVFASAACLSLISIGLGIAYYRSLSHAASAHNGPHQPNAHIQMGQPNAHMQMGQPDVPPPKLYV